ncbi:type VI secretion system tube protein Hcp [Variovorax paradoxus]|nr:type VI secretion system tube protein Hcp [Variovorax paradoxus]
MSSDYFVKIKGAEGESDKTGHKDEIEIESWSWGVANASSASIGGGSGQGKASPTDISFSAPMSKATSNLIKMCAKGEHLEEVKLSARKSAGGQEDYLIITLNDAFVTGIHTGGAGGGQTSSTTSIAFKKFKIEFKIQDNKTGAVKPGTEFKWDVAKSDF